MKVCFPVMEQQGLESQSQEGTIAKNVALFQSDGLPEYLPGHTCGGHGNSDGCAH